MADTRRYTRAMAGETTSLSGMQRRAAGNRAHNRMVLQKLVVFSILMVVVPMTTFYGVRSLFKPGMPGSEYADAWRFVRMRLCIILFSPLGLTIQCITIVLIDSGFTAVLSVNIVIGLYILSAWKEDDGKEVAQPVGRFAKAKEQ